MTRPVRAPGNRLAGSRLPPGGRKPAGPGWRPGFVVGLLLVVAAGLAWWAWPSRGPDVRRAANLTAPGDLVVFFGDSITQGYGVRSEESFPALAGQALGVPIVNAGVPGDTMRAGLARIGRDVLPLRPRLTVVEFGGNDFLRRVPVEETLRGLEAIVSTLIGEGMMVVILEVSVGLGGDPYLEGYRAIADRHGAILVPDIMKGILSSPDLKADTIHPNAKGHRLIADRVIGVVAPLLTEANRRRGS
jgi:acyl-CoA thioesterase I